MASKVHVCIVNVGVYSLFSTASRTGMIGGSEVWAHAMSYFLSKYYQVSVVCGDWGQKPKERYGGVDVYSSVSLRSKFLPWQVVRFWCTLSRVNADVYISSGVQKETGLIRLFCWYKKKKHILRIFSQGDCDMTHIKDAPYIFRFFYQWGLKYADAIVVISREQEHILKAHHPDLRAPIIYIPLGMKMHALPSFQKRTSILWVGRCVSFKRPELFLDIAQRFPDETFVMIAPQDRKERKFFDRIRQRADSIPNVRFYDYVSFENIQVMFNEAKVLLNTSLWEGFPHTFIQSGIAGTPIISLAVNPDNVITEYNIGCTANGDIVRMMHDLRHVLENTQEWNVKSKSIGEYVRTHHDLEAMGRAWHALILQHTNDFRV